MSRILQFRFDLRALLICVTACGFFFGAANCFVHSLFDLYASVYFFSVLVGFISEWLFQRNRLECKAADKTAEFGAIRFAPMFIIVLLIMSNIVFSSPEPTVFFPYPFMLLYSISQGSQLKLFLIPTLSYFVLTSQLDLAIERDKIPLRVPVLLASMSICTLVWFSVLSREAMAVFGIDYFASITSVNFLWLMALWLLLYFTRNRATYKKAICWILLFHVWLISYAFPLLIDPNEIADMSKNSMW